jgi:hypothetical protein
VHLAEVLNSTAARARAKNKAVIPGTEVLNHFYGRLFKCGAYRYEIRGFSIYHPRFTIAAFCGGRKISYNGFSPAGAAGGRG